MTRTHYADDRWERRNWLCGGVWGSGDTVACVQRQVKLISREKIVTTTQDQHAERAQLILLYLHATPERLWAIATCRVRTRAPLEACEQSSASGSLCTWWQLPEATCMAVHCQLRDKAGATSSAYVRALESA